MSGNRQIQHFINIDAPAGHVWAVFTNPELTRKLGGEYITEWKQGSDFGWRDLEGNMLTTGMIVAIIPAKLLKIQLVDPLNKDRLISTITYELNEYSGSTRLSAVEVIHYAVTDEEYAEANEGWKEALFAVADIAEKIGLQ